MDRITYILKQYLEVVSEHTGIPTNVIKSKVRQRQVADARHLMHRLSREKGFSLNQIGMFMGLDHTSVLQSSRQAATVPELIKKYQALELALYNHKISGIMERTKDYECKYIRVFEFTGLYMISLSVDNRLLGVIDTYGFFRHSTPAKIGQDAQKEIDALCERIGKSEK